MVRRSFAAVLTSVLLGSGLVMVAAPAADAAAAKPRTFANCTALNKVYPHGIGRKGAKDRVSGRSRPVTNFKVDTATYNANKKSDRDKGGPDGIACEKR